MQGIVQQGIYRLLNTGKTSNLITFSEIFCNSNDLLGSKEYLVSSIVSCSEFLSQINCVSSYSQSWKGDFRERRDWPIYDPL